MIDSDRILGIVTLLYVVLFLVNLVHLASKSEKTRELARVLLYVTLGLHTIGLLMRWVQSYGLGFGHAPLSNFYESLIFFAWCIALLLAVVRKRLGFPLMDVCGVFGALLLMAYASLSPAVDRHIQPLVPALQSNWLHVHVFTCFLAYASFTVAFICAVLYFFKWDGVIPPKKRLEEVNYQGITVGFFMLTAGILTGAVWAHYAWGSYWSWDPKETWSLITWIIYALFLHARFAKGWRGKRIALLSIVGFMSVIFTYFGVNFVLSGLHSYGAS